MATAQPSDSQIGKKELTPTMKFHQEEQNYKKHLTLGVEEKLQKNRMIKDIKVVINKPAEKSLLSSWERKNASTLPQELRDFYTSTNGFKITWSLEHAGDTLKIGEMSINPINQLVHLESLDPVHHKIPNPAPSQTAKKGESLEVGTRPDGKVSCLTQDISKLQLSQLKKMYAGGGKTITADGNFSTYFAELRQTLEANGQVPAGGKGKVYLKKKDKVFILDQSKYGWVGLVYPEARNSVRSGKSENTADSKIEIWFLDNSLQWHYLAPTFSHYYRMLLFHLGLPQWQYRFTPYGLSSWAEQMFWLVAPHLLQPVDLSTVSKSTDFWSSDVPKEAAVPNPTANVLSSHLFKRKKKERIE